MTDYAHIGELAAIATAVFWTLSSLAWTTAGRTIGANAVSFVRLVIAVGLLSLYLAIMGQTPLPRGASMQAWYTLGLSGFVGFFLSDLCLFKGFLVIGPRLSLLTYSLAPPMAAVIAWAFQGDRLGPKDWIAMAVTLAGVTWVVSEQSNHETHHTKHQLRRGLLLATFAAVGQAVSVVLGKAGMNLYADPVGATYIRVIGGLLGYFWFTTLTGRWRPVAMSVRFPRVLLIMLFGTIAGPFVGVILYMFALERCHAGVVATIISTMPVLILPFSVWLHRERVSPRAVLGAVISVIGVALLMLPTYPD